MLHPVRRTFIFWLVALFPLLGLAQVAPDIATGTTVEDMIKAYGWPNGKSVSDNREVWLYDDFQVALQAGRVVNVWTLPPDKRQPKRSRPLPLDVRKTQSVAPRPSTTANPNPTRTITVPTPAVQAPAERPAQEPVAPTDPIRRAVRQRGVRVFDLWPVLAIGCVLVIGFVMYTDKKRIAREVAEMTGARSSTPPSSAKTWQESVAESVARTQSSAASAHGATGTGRHASSPTNAAATSRAAESTASAFGVPTVFTELTYELLDRLEWKRLELITELYYRQTGLRAECTCVGPDGGIDVQLYRPGEKRPFCFVQCKAMSWKVDVKMIRELNGVMASAKVSEGVFITTGRYSRDALAFAAKNNIRAIDGRDFVALFNQLPREARVHVLAKVTDGDYTTPTCSRCDIKMVLKQSVPPTWSCRRCNGRLRIRNTRLAALRAAGS